MGKGNLEATPTQCPVPPMLEIFKPLIDAATGVSLSDPDAARAELNSRLDPDSPEGHQLSQALVELLEAGKVADRGAPPVRYSRAAKATEETGGFSIDVVDMTGPGPRHRHPNAQTRAPRTTQRAPRRSQRTQTARKAQPCTCSACAADADARGCACHLAAAQARCLPTLVWSSTRPAHTAARRSTWRWPPAAQVM